MCIDHAPIAVSVSMLKRRASLGPYFVPTENVHHVTLEEGKSCKRENIFIANLRLLFVTIPGVRRPLPWRRGARKWQWPVLPSAALPVNYQEKWGLTREIRPHLRICGVVRPRN